VSTADRVAAIRARLGRATRGPWEHVGNLVRDTHAYNTICRVDLYGVGPVDADLIANAPDDLAWLLEELEQARKHGDNAWHVLEKVRAERDALVAENERLTEQVADLARRL
jgi:hypothetical protein